MNMRERERERVSKRERARERERERERERGGEREVTLNLRDSDESLPGLYTWLTEYIDRKNSSLYEYQRVRERERERERACEHNSCRGTASLNVYILTVLL